MERDYLKAEQLYGEEVGPAIDNTPIAIPAGFKRPETMEERLRRFIRNELSEAAAREGEETFEEANDFDIPEDPVDPSTPFEEYFDPTLGRALTPDEMNKYESAYREEYLRRQAGLVAEEDRREAFRQAVEEHVRRQRSSGAGGPQPQGAPSPEENPKTP